MDQVRVLQGLCVVRWSAVVMRWPASHYTSDLVRRSAVVYSIHDGSPVLAQTQRLQLDIAVITSLFRGRMASQAMQLRPYSL